MSDNSDEITTEDKAEKTPAIRRKAGEVLNSTWFKFARASANALHLAYKVYEFLNSLFS